MAVKIREIPPASGKWYVKVDYRQRRVAKCFSSLERAQDVADKIAKAIDIYGVEALRMFRQPETTAAAVKIPTVAEFAAKWELELEKRDLKLATRMSYKSNLKHHIIPALGEKLLTEVDYPLLKEFVCRKAEGTYSTARFRKVNETGENAGSEDDREPGQNKKYTRDSIRLMVMTMRAMMAEAVREKLIPANPVADLSPFYRKQKQERAVRRSDVYTPEELYAIEDVLRTKPTLFEPDTYELTLCMSRTGMRVGEARGLMPSDLDYRARTIEVQRNIPSGHNRLEESTKGKIGHRTVDMGKDLYLALKADGRPPARGTNEVGKQRSVGLALLRQRRRAGRLQQVLRRLDPGAEDRRRADQESALAPAHLRLGQSGPGGGLGVRVETARARESGDHSLHLHPLHPAQAKKRLKCPGQNREHPQVTRK